MSKQRNERLNNTLTDNLINSLKNIGYGNIFICFFNFVLSFSLFFEEWDVKAKQVFSDLQDKKCHISIFQYTINGYNYNINVIEMVFMFSNINIRSYKFLYHLHETVNPFHNCTIITNSKKNTLNSFPGFLSCINVSFFKSTALNVQI